MNTPRLPRDYTRCADGAALDCPFTYVCRRWLTKAYDLHEGNYSYAEFASMMTKDETGETYCEHRIIWDPPK